MELLDNSHYLLNHQNQLSLRGYNHENLKTTGITHMKLVHVFVLWKHVSGMTCRMFLKCAIMSGWLKYIR